MNRHACTAFAVLLTGSAAIASAQQGPQHGNRRTFVSPMGEPFHGTDAAPDPERAWFTAVDSNGDGVLTRNEFQADASRFFKRLDRKQDGEIDPDDIDYYETTIAPEVRSGDGGPGIIARSDTASEGSARAPAYDASKLGAARFSYFDLPEPVTAADRNFNRGIDAQEFANAADKRFTSLDKKGDGRLTWDELPHVTSRAVSYNGRGRGRGGPGGGGPRGGHRGGLGGGGAGMGGMGAGGNTMTGGRGED